MLRPSVGWRANESPDHHVSRTTVPPMPVAIESPMPPVQRQLLVVQTCPWQIYQVF